MAVLIRADGYQEIGTGHVMRMLALAEALRERGTEVTLASSGLGDWPKSQAASRGLSIVERDIRPGSGADAAWVVDLAHRSGSTWVVADGYEFRSAFQNSIKAANLRLLLVDDFGHAESYSADIVLNQNLNPDRTLYTDREPGTRLLLGPRYAQVRRAVVELGRREPDSVGALRRVLVTLGGSHPREATRTLAQALAALEERDLEVRFVTGLPRSDALGEAADDHRFVVLPPTNELPELMKWADLAIAGAGITVYELCCIGVPTLLVVLADNQVEPARAIDRLSVQQSLGWHADLTPATITAAVRRLGGDPDARRAMVRAGHALVDGRGSERVVSEMYPPD